MTPDTTLLENHLAFLATHRGTVARRDGFVLVDSTLDDFTFAVVEGATSVDALPDRFRQVRLVPWSRIAEADLVGRGLERNGAFSYRTLERPLSPRPARPDLSIRLVADAGQMDAFSEVQTRAFLEEGESFDMWFAWLRERNQQNLGNPAQRFYLASLGEELAGVTLTVRSDGLLGIYAVATLPAHRNQGVSSALLAHAIDEGRREGATRVTLQVRSGSYAESLYEKLGFAESFVTPTFTR